MVTAGAAARPPALLRTRRAAPGGAGAQRESIQRPSGERQAAPPQGHAKPRPARCPTGRPASSAPRPPMRPAPAVRDAGIDTPRGAAAPRQPGPRRTGGRIPRYGADLHFRDRGGCHRRGSEALTRHRRRPALGDQHPPGHAAGAGDLRRYSAWEVEDGETRVGDTLRREVGAGSPQANLHLVEWPILARGALSAPLQAGAGPALGLSWPG